MSSDDEAKLVDEMDDVTLKAELKKLKKRMRKPHVVVRNEKRISKKFDGEKASKFPDWKYTAEAAIQGREKSEKVEMVIAALEGKALREVLRHSENERNSAEKIMSLLELKYADRRSSAQIRREFYALSQGSKSIIDFSDLLIECIEGTEKILGLDASGIEAMLQEQFADNVNDPSLRWELKRARKDKTAGKDQSFDELRNIALEYEAGQGPKSKSAKGHSDEHVQSPSEIVQLTQAVEKLSGKVDQLNSRVGNVEGRLNNTNYSNSGRSRWPRYGGYGYRGGYRGRGGYDNYDRNDRQGQGRFQGEAAQEPNGGLNPNANDFAPSNPPAQNQGNGQPPRRA